MPKALTPEQCRARARALEAAATHLLYWTRDPAEIEQGDVIYRQLAAECKRYRALALAREFGNPLLARKF